MGAEPSITRSQNSRISQFKQLLPVLTVSAIWFVVGLALARLLFEWRFPAMPGLGRPLPVLVLALFLAATGFLLARRHVKHVAQIVPFFPLLLNLIWLVDPAIDPPRSRFLFAVSLWLVAVLLVHEHVSDPNQRRWRRLGPLFIALILFPVYLLTMSHAVGEADTFEFQVVGPSLGIAHPTGYPLYLLLGKLFSLLPVSTVAWRVNLASAVFAVAAAGLVYMTAYRLLRRPLPSLAGAVVLGLVPIFWSQAIIAEVYTLHALIVAIALRLMIRILDEQHKKVDVGRRTVGDNRKVLIALAFVLGLGLTNHLTTLFLLPPAAVTFAVYAGGTIRTYRRSAISGPRSLLWLLALMLLAFLAPLLLYAYLPLRWQAVNGESMGFVRFVDWVVGGRFQGALQWGAWRSDPARSAIVGRLLLDAWGWIYLVVAAVGLVTLFKRLWPAALVFLISAAGFTFYALNYYVPDLAVFLIPAHVVIAVWVAAGVGAIISFLEHRFHRGVTFSQSLPALVFILALLPAFIRAGGLWATIDQSSRDGGETWGRGVLAQPLARGAAILADSEKIAPLYYLQQIEGIRPDLSIMVLPDEATYRAELDVRLAAGQTVYLARFLPGLEGVYHLRSAGPLVEVSMEAITDLPDDVASSDLVVGPLRLLGYRVDPEADVDPSSTMLTLYWLLDRPLISGDALPVLNVRWSGPGQEKIVITGRHPVSNYYPLNAWRPGEIVVDTHILPIPDAGCEPHEISCDIDIQIAAAPRFSPTSDLDWQTVTSVNLIPRSGPVGLAQRAYFDEFALDGVDFQQQARAGARLPLRYSGYGQGASMSYLLVPSHAVSSFVFPAESAPDGEFVIAESNVFTAVLDPAGEAGPYALVALPAGELKAVCGWLARPTTGCVVAEVNISGISLSEGAVNFDDQIALLDISLPDLVPVPGGQFPIEVTWQGLAPMSEDYTVFVQVLDHQDRIVGQVDSWPVQGTFPTSQWRPGEIVRDPYVVQLSDDFQPGDFRVHVGFYLLATLQRLLVIDEAGNPVDDKVEVRVIYD
jgi:hypothetical protein